MSPAGKFAANTDVTVERSKAELEGTLDRYGADQFMYATTPGRAVVGFRAQGRFVRFVLPLPDRDAPEFTHTTRRINQHAGGVKRVELTPDQQAKAYEQACRQRWRALCLVVKAKLEAVESGIVDFEREFLAHILLPDGTTVAEHVQPLVEQAYVTGALPDWGGMLALGTGS